MMLKRVVILLMSAWLGCVSSHAGQSMLMTDTLQMTESALMTDTLLHDIAATSITLPTDTTPVVDKDAWKRRILRKGWSINDTTIVYPPVLDFGVKAYRWLNHALNLYDTTYVVNSGKKKRKKFKVMLKNSNWLDFYSGHLRKW